MIDVFYEFNIFGVTAQLADHLGHQTLTATLLQRPDFLSHMHIEIGWLLMAYCFGISLYAVYASITGGIVAKSADVSADWVGQVDFDLHEDDRRNAAAILDQVGDQVNGIWARFVQLIETIVMAIVVTTILGAWVGDSSDFTGALIEFITPLMVGATALLSGGIGIAIGSVNPSGHIRIMPSMVVGSLVMVGALLAFQAVGLMPLATLTNVMIGMLLALLVAIWIVKINQSSDSAVSTLVDQTNDSHVLGLFGGLSMGIYQVVFPFGLLIVAMLSAFFVSGGFAHFQLGMAGVGYVALGMLPVLCVGTMLAAIKPMLDNRRGIYLMAHQGNKPDISLSPIEEQSSIGQQLMHALSTLSTALIGGGIALLYALSLVRWVAKTTTDQTIYELNGVQFSWDQAIVNANTNVMHVSDLSLSILVEILNLNVLNMELLIGILVGVCVPLICIAWLLRGLHQSVDRLSTDCKAMLNQDPDIWNYTKVPGCDHLLLTLMMSARRQALWLIAGALGGVLVASLLFGVSGMIGLVTATIATSVVMVLALFSIGLLWKRTRSALDDMAKESHEQVTGDADLLTGHALSRGQLSALVNDMVGDACKDLLAPSLGSIARLIILFGVFCSSIALSFEFW